MFPNPANVVPDHLIDPRLRQAGSSTSQALPFCNVDQNWLGIINVRQFASAPHAAGSLGTGGVSGIEVNSRTPFYNQLEPGTYGCAHVTAWDVSTSLVPPCDTEGAGMASSGMYPVSSLQQSGGPTASAFWPDSDFRYPVTGAYGISPHGNAAPTPLNGFPSYMVDPRDFSYAMPGGQESFIMNPDPPLLEHADPDPSTRTGPPKEFLRDTVIRNKPFPKGSTIWSATPMYLTINDRATMCLGRDRRIVLTNTEKGLTATGFCNRAGRNSVTIERHISGSILDGSGKDHLTLTCSARTKGSHQRTFVFGLENNITLISQRSTKTRSKGPEEYELSKSGDHLDLRKTTNMHNWRPKPTQWYQMGQRSYVKPAS